MKKQVKNNQSATPVVTVKNLTKSFNDKKVLDQINLTVEENEVISIIGPSGTGKSTLLRCINYLTVPTAGEITINNITVNAENAKPKDINKLRKQSAMVFQDYNLFKNMTVLENVSEALVLVQKKSKAEAKEIAIDAIEKVGLTDKLNAYPQSLSGGQQQRVGIARAIATRPAVLLLDEPTSALDPELINEMLKLIESLIETFNMTTLIVSHEMNFVRDISSRVLFIDEGHIKVQGTPDEVFNQSTDERLNRFLSRITH